MVGSTQVPTVSARHLHAFLEVGKDFSDWVKGRVDAFGFVEGQDFVVVEGLRYPNLDISKSRPQTTKEYFLSIDMAKELSMVERNEKGKQARRYFIECEKRMVEGTAAPPWAPFINCCACWNRLIKPPLSQLMKTIHFQP